MFNIVYDPKQSPRRAQFSYYLDRLTRHGTATAAAVGWSDYLQVNLFEKLMKIFGGCSVKERASMLDAGCGLGDFSIYMKRAGYKNFTYKGIDFIPEMISAARGKYPDENFQTIDFMNPDFIETFDYILCSGALNMLSASDAAAHERYIMRFIDKMYRLSKRGCAFNLLAGEGAGYFPDDSRFFYADRERILSFCTTLGGETSVDYNEHEFVFTIRIFKK
jgi:SAM-dependent methyltransferase